MLTSYQIEANATIGSLEKWGHDRGIDPLLLRLNTQVWDAVPAESSHDEAAEILSPICAYMGDEAEGTHSEYYATRSFQNIQRKYGLGGFSIEGIDPTTGEPSNYPRFRPVEPFRYLDKGQQKQAKYLSRKGSAVQDFFARVPLHIAQKIADRYGLTYDRPAEGFWAWVRESKLPIILAEGEGDALAVLSRGFVGVGIPGHHMAFQKGTKQLRPALEWLLTGGSPATIAFDRDEKPKTIAAVEHSRRKLSKALIKLGVQVTIAQWEPGQGKGAGDLPPHILEDALDRALPVGSVDPWAAKQARSRITGEWDDSVVIEASSTEELICHIENLPRNFILVIDAPTGSGKTQAFSKALSRFEASKCLAAFFPQRSLAAGGSKALEIPYLNESRKGLDHRVGAVINSAHKVSPIAGYDVFLDEFEQSLDSLSFGTLNRQGRGDKVDAFKELSAKADRIVMASATGCSESVKLMERLTGFPSYIVKFHPDHGFTKGGITLYRGEEGVKGSQAIAKSEVIKEIGITIAQGDRVWVPTDTASEALAMGVRAREWGLKDKEVLILTDETKDDPRVQDVLGCPDPGQWFTDHPDIKLVAVSPVAASGWSVVTDPPSAFSLRACIFNGKSVAPSLACQQVPRLRNQIRSIAFVANHGLTKKLVGTTHTKAQGSYHDRTKAAVEQNTQEREALIRQNMARAGVGFAEYRKDEFYEYAQARQIRLNEERYFFADSFAAYLERDGWEVQTIVHGGGQPAKDDEIRAEVKRVKATPIANASPIEPDRYTTLMAKPERTHQERWECEAYAIRDFYGLKWNAPLTIEQVIEEGFGKGRRQDKNMARSLIQGLALEHDRQRLSDLGEGIYSFDMSNHALSEEIMEQLGVYDILNHCYQLSESGEGYLSSDPKITEWWEKIQSYAQHLGQQPSILGVRLPADGNPLRFIGVMFHRLGIKTRSERRRGDGLKRRYWICEDSLDEARQRARRIREKYRKAGYSLRSTGLLEVLLPYLDHEGGKNPPTPPPREKEDDPPPKNDRWE
jgi:hypothetical protein